MERTPRTLLTTATAGLALLGLTAAPALADQRTDIDPTLRAQDDDVSGALTLFTVDDDGDGFHLRGFGERADDELSLGGAAAQTDGDETTGGHGTFTTDDEGDSSGDLGLGTGEQDDRDAIDLHTATDEDDEDASLDLSATTDGERELDVTADSDDGIDVDTPNDDGEDDDELLGDIG